MLSVLVTHEGGDLVFTAQFPTFPVVGDIVNTELVDTHAYFPAEVINVDYPVDGSWRVVRRGFNVGSSECGVTCWIEVEPV